MKNLINDALSRSKETAVDIDDLKNKKANIKVFGVGGSGGNTISRMKEVGIEGASLVAVNTDAQDLLKTGIESHILIGKKLTKGLGSGAEPTIGEAAAKEDVSYLKETIKGSDIVFITCGFGGGTGTGASPVIARVARELGILTIAVVTLPFTMEGTHRKDNAVRGIEKIKEFVDTLIVVPNDKLLEIIPDVPMNIAFKISDEVLVNAVKGITEVITKPGLINLDFADVKAIMRNGGLSLIGMGESEGNKRGLEAATKALNNPLLDVDISGAKNSLIYVVGSPDMTLNEARDVVQSVNSKLDSDAKIIWGANIDPNIKSTLRVLLIVTGVPVQSVIKGSAITVKSSDIAELLNLEMIEAKSFDQVEEVIEITN